MTILNSGNVGIGTTSSSTVLTIGSGTMTLKNASTDSNGLKILQGASDTAQIINYYNSPLQFGTNNTVQMAILGTGNVGIGLTDPNFKLETLLTSAIRANSTTDVAETLGAGTASSHFTYTRYISDTTYPAGGLEVLRGNAGANAVSTITHRGTGKFSIVSSEAGSIGLSTSGVQRVLIDSAGIMTQTGVLIQATAQTPASAAATCTTGTQAWDTGFQYVCTATDTWKRVAMATW